MISSVIVLNLTVNRSLELPLLGYLSHRDRLFYIIHKAILCVVFFLKELF